MWTKSTWRKPLRTAVILLAWTAAPAAWGFYPATDTSGPLTLRIEAPAEVTQAGVAQPVRAVLENSGGEPLKVGAVGSSYRWQ